MSNERKRYTPGLLNKFNRLFGCPPDFKGKHIEKIVNQYGVQRETTDNGTTKIAFDPLGMYNGFLQAGVDPNTARYLTIQRVGPIDFYNAVDEELF